MSQGNKFIDDVIQKACADPKRIVFPESTEPRILEASRVITEKGIAEVILIGDTDEIKEAAAKANLDHSKVIIIDPVKSEKYDEYVNTFYELRKHKGITEGEAKEIAKKPIYFGTLMVHAGDADGLVSGSIHSTGETIKPALQIIKTKPSVSIASSVFFMAIDDN